jgi:hypothetical protein
MTTTQIKAIQEKIGTAPDGFWGPKSTAACQAYLRALMPTPNPWPWTSSGQSSLRQFYGDPSKGEVAGRLVPINVAGLGVQYSGKDVSTIRCHSRVAESLLRVLTAISESPFRGWLAGYAGVYNHRPMRGGSRWSLHAYGAAIDIMPHGNGLHTHWPTRAKMPLEIMEHFAREGWLAAGAFWGKDAMHFEATR